MIIRSGESTKTYYKSTMKKLRYLAIPLEIVVNKRKLPMDRKKVIF